ncbi:MAG: co-chaperone GroES [Planctomycetota bacterium]
MPATATKQALTPLGNKLVLRRDEAETETASGIILPESAKDQPKTGIVEAVGPGNLNTDTGERIPLNLSVGDRVIFSSYAGTEIKLGADDVLILSESDVLAVID